MATVRFVSPEHASILRDYLGCDDGGAVILVMPEVQDTVRGQGLDDGEFVEYDFGGQPDLSVEMVSSTESYFINEIAGGDD